QLNFMKPVWMSSAFLRIGWPSAVVGEARLQKPTAQNTNNGFNITLYQFTVGSPESKQRGSCI
ncbi:MAG: hypothetical protein ABIO55_16130, partial [Ginsengibacter sp.]